MSTQYSKLLLKMHNMTKEDKYIFFSKEMRKLTYVEMWK